MVPERLSQIIEGARRLLYDIDTTNLEIVGRTLVEEANRLKGLPRKCAQLMGDRKDLIESEAIREHLRSLQADCEKRNSNEIQLQVSAHRRLEVLSCVKAGTIAEVSRVRDIDNHIEYAVKTVNLKSKTLFEEDFQMLDGRAGWILETVKKGLSAASLPGDTLKQITVILHTLFSSLRSDEFRSNLMGEFNLAVEKSNLDNAKARLERSNLNNALAMRGVQVGVPTTVSVSEDGTVLLMEWISGTNISDYVSSCTIQQRQPSLSLQQGIFKAVVAYYFHGLLVDGRAHRDLHPGNIIIQESMDAGIPSLVWFVDMGSELQPEENHIRHMANVLKYIHCDSEDGKNDQSYKQMWQLLGVTSMKDGDEQFRYISKSFDLIESTAGLNLKENAEKTQFLLLPAWVLLWQAASSAIVMTLQMLQKLPGSQEVNVKAIVEEALQETLEAMEASRSRATAATAATAATNFSNNSNSSSSR